MLCVTVFFLILLWTFDTVDYAYEHEQKRTYLPMLIQVGIYLPLLVGLFLLYPWLAGSKKIKYSQQTEDSEDQEKTKLIKPNSQHNHDSQ